MLSGRPPTAARSLRVGGLTPLTTVDWPDRLAAVVFTRGCPWRCPYCHNAELRRRDGRSYDWDKVLGFLNTRRGLLDGVVFSGGEPCLQPALADALAEVRALGFATALHTGGNYPERLAALLDAGLLDWVGLDVKAPWADYPLVTGQPGSGERARRSLRLLLDSGVAHELRTTVWPQVLSPLRLRLVAGQLAALGAGAHNWVLQPCRLDAAGAEAAAPALQRLANRIAPALGPVQVRA
jgi:pyruvate formate lyase activating enzyme